LTLAIALCGYPVASAATETDTYEEAEVVVTASRVQQPQAQAPGTTEVITRQDIEASGTEQGSVAQALSANGQPIAQYSGTGTASIRLDGADSQQTLVMVNGVPANTGTLGMVDLSAFPAASVERIEVTHGPLSALYGANALGGVVNIITDLTGEPQNQVSLAGGTFDTGRFNVTTIQERWGFAIGRNITDGSRARSDLAANYFTGQYNFFEEEDNYLKLYLQATSKQIEVPGSVAYPVFQGEQSDDSYTVNLNGKSQFLAGTWEYKLYHQFWDEDYDQPAYAGAPYYQLEDHGRYRSKVLGSDIAGTYTLGEHEILGGLTVKQTKFESDKAGAHTQDDWAFFAQDTYRPIPGLSLIGGLRQDHSSQFGSELSPRVSLVQQVGDALTLKYGYGEAYRVPTINDLYWDQVGMYSNPDLRPERGRRFDISAEYRQGVSTWTVNLFRNRLRDGIQWTPVDLSNPLGNWLVDNVARSKVNGVTIGWKGTWQLLTGWVNYHWLDREDDAYGTGNYQAGNFFGKNQVDLGLTLGDPKANLNLNWKFVRNRTWSGSELSGYNVGDLNFRYRFTPSFAMSLGIANLTDQEYAVYSGYPMPGRAGLLTAKYSF
jgi:outer membrane cobalamin receptor